LFLPLKEYSPKSLETAEAPDFVLVKYKPARNEDQTKNGPGKPENLFTVYGCFAFPIHPGPNKAPRKMSREVVLLDVDGVRG